MAVAYHFLRGEYVTHKELTVAHGQATLARIREHALVLCLEDITVPDHNGRQMTGLGPLSDEAQREPR